MAAAEQQQQQGGIGNLLSMAFRGLMFYWLFTSFFKGSSQPSSPSPSPGSGEDTSDSIAQPPQSSSPSQPPPSLSGYHTNLFSKGEPMYLVAYLSPNQTFKPELSHEEPVWREDGLVYTDDSVDERRIETKIAVADHPHLLENGTMYLHLFVTKQGKRPVAHSRHCTHLSYPVVHFFKKPKDEKKKNLLSQDEEDVGTLTEEGSVHDEREEANQKSSDDVNGHFLDEEDNNDGEEAEGRAVQQNDGPADLSSFLASALMTAKKAVGKDDNRPVVPFWQEQVDVQVVVDYTAYKVGGVPAPMLETLRFHHSGAYYPPVYPNELWSLREKMIQINESVTELPLNLTFSTLSNFKYQLYVQMEKSFSMHQSFGAMGEDEIEDIKRMFLDTNPFLLAVTMVVSLLHSVFDFLAFKNDISFWKENKSMEGLSGRTIIINAASQLIIFLYLLDNETSWLIIISSFVGMCIEVWKIKKAFHVSTKKWRGIPFISIEDRGSYKKSKTKEYDELAMRYLSYLLFPLVLGYAVYSLYYETHRSVYSFIISTLVGCVYTFGFIMMTPQLFINYKMKSVAHLPWKVFMYKALNTFIDDLFAFIIKMPTLHRLSCFRDDLIFGIYLYQRWKYPVDKTRANEFGQVFEGREGEEGKEGGDEGRDANERSGEKEGDAGVNEENTVVEVVEEDEDVLEETKVEGSSELRQRKARDGKEDE